MAILTDEERKMIDEGKISYTELIRQRAIENKDKHSINHNALDLIKQKIRDANIRYKEAIQRNKDLYAEIEASRKAKEVCRNEIAALRIEKKKILGIDVKEEENSEVIDNKENSEISNNIENNTESEISNKEVDNEALDNKEEMSSEALDSKEEMSSEALDSKEEASSEVLESKKDENNGIPEVKNYE